MLPLLLFLFVIFTLMLGYPVAFTLSGVSIIFALVSSTFNYFDIKNFKIKHFYQKKGISDFNYLRSLTYLTAKLISKIEVELKKKIDFLNLLF